jgi:hypothetical protein
MAAISCRQQQVTSDDVRAVSSSALTDGPHARDSAYAAFVAEEQRDATDRDQAAIHNIDALLGQSAAARSGKMWLRAVCIVSAAAAALWSWPHLIRLMPGP